MVWANMDASVPYLLQTAASKELPEGPHNAPRRVEAGIRLQRTMQAGACIALLCLLRWLLLLLLLPLARCSAAAD
jgi:hypothetical protein